MTVPGYRLGHLKTYINLIHNDLNSIEIICLAIKNKCL